MAKQANPIFNFGITDDNKIETKTLDDVFNLEKKKSEELEKYKRDLIKETANIQSKDLERRYKNLQQQITKLEMDGVKVTQAYRLKLQKEAIKQEQEERLKSQKELYKKELENLKKSQRGTKEKLSDNNKLYQQNKETLDLLKVIASQRKLTKDEKKLQKDTREEQAKINRENAAMQIQQGLVNALQGLSDSINSNMKTYVNLHKGTNARLQGYTGSGILGLGLRTSVDKYGVLENRLTSAVGVNPYFRTEAMLTNLSNLINEGIASNVEQRAFLQTASENIANTFDVANGALLRIVRLQQQDSSAARLGMEAYLTRFLNGLVENTEYLNKTFDTVQEALIETSSHMSIQASTELEYVIQKWLGALVGVGMSESTASNLAQAIGYLGSGNIEALSGNALQNLLVMAANKSNLGFGSLLTSGLNASNADALMANLVNYMIEIEKSGNNVVKSQFANTFGITFSDLAAASNLAGSMSSLYGNQLSFGGMYNELAMQLMQVPLRMTMSEMLDNVWENLEFGLASNVASSPALSAIWKVTDMIQSQTGGINIPFISAAGFGIDLNTTIENLVKLGVVGISSLGMIGDMVSGLSTSLVPSSALLKLGILPSNTAISRGSGLGTFSSGLTTSSSAMNTVANASGSDISESALAGATQETSSATMDEDQENSKQADISTINIYKYLSETFDNKLDRLLSYVDGLESELTEIKSKMNYSGGWGLSIT